MRAEMSAAAAGSSATPGVPFWRLSPRLWIRLSLAAAGLAMVGNGLALAWLGRIYGSAYPSLTDQAVAQDLTNLFLVSPLLIGLAVGASRGSARAGLGWLAGVMFTVYNYVIYTMSIHFGPLFLLWVAVLGLATYAAIGGLASIEPAAVRRRIAGEPRRFAGWFLIATGILFAVLWLADIIGALASGGTPATVMELGVPTNAVHVLDLAIFLPAVIVAGTRLIQGGDLGAVLAPVLVLFLALTGLPILLTPLVAQLRGDPAEWGVAAPIAVLTAISLTLFVRLTRPARPS